MERSVEALLYLSGGSSVEPQGQGPGPVSGSADQLQTDEMLARQLQAELSATETSGSWWGTAQHSRQSRPDDASGAAPEGDDADPIQYVTNAATAMGSAIVENVRYATDSISRWLAGEGEHEEDEAQPRDESQDGALGSSALSRSVGHRTSWAAVPDQPGSSSPRLSLQSRAPQTDAGANENKKDK
ncbi:hypothetical protein WJX72_012265 [[Myrmecia] bisecta]|uniref:Uncharacterized protein n=1 Tax=[Myrmecia] bisecta TaxID=41462 RepID=A0AAW1PR08_9CHLO